MEIDNEIIWEVIERTVFQHPLPETIEEAQESIASVGHQLAMTGTPVIIEHIVTPHVHVVLPVMPKGKGFA